MADPAGLASGAPKYGFDLFARNGSGPKEGWLVGDAYNRQFKASLRRPRIQYHVNAAAQILEDVGRSVGLTRPERLALGAAMGTTASRKRA